MARSLDYGRRHKAEYREKMGPSKPPTQRCQCGWRVSFEFIRHDRETELIVEHSRKAHGRALAIYPLNAVKLEKYYQKNYPHDI